MAGTHSACANSPTRVPAHGVSGKNDEGHDMSLDQALEKYDRMCAAIAECHRFDEVKVIHDKAVAFAAYAKQAKNLKAEQQACWIRMRAERRCGELLIEMAEKGERQKRGGDQKSKLRDVTSIPELSDLGISKYQSSQWQRLADIPADLFQVLAKSQKSSARILDAYERSMAAPGEGFNCEQHWKGMPEFSQEDLMPVRDLTVHFQAERDVEAFAELVGQKIGPKTKSIWYPAVEQCNVSHLRWVSAPTQAPDHSDDLVEVLDERVEESAAEAC